MLSDLIGRKTLTVLGLNSGTSGDGLDLAAVKIGFSSKRPAVKFLVGKTVPYPESLHERVNDLIQKRLDSVDALISLDRNLGAFYGRQARIYCDYLRGNKIRVDLIASHGQTVRHLPGKISVDRKRASGTLQLGHPETVALKTGLPVVADFRQADIAGGGEGAPITALAMWLLFSSPEEDRLLINIGGIANYFLFPAGGSEKDVRAADCGPGNSLMDILAARYFRRKYDPGGKLAAKGKISRRLLSLVAADNFLKKKYGPSTGRERFGEEFADRIVKYASTLKLSRRDIMATTTELTAVAVANNLEETIARMKIGRIYLFGGGTRNAYLVERIAANLGQIDFYSVDRLGYNPDYLEAACYAVMGGMTLKGIANTLPHITRAGRKTIAGRIIQPPAV
jgi:anhydro-N-acetylmuramic acid kinase